MSGQKKAGGLNRPKGHPPSGDLFALGSKSSRQSNSPSPALPPAKKPHLEELDEGTSSGGNVLFSDPIKIAQSKVGVVSESTSKLVTASLPGSQPIEVRPVDLVAAIEECVDKNPSKVERILTGSFKQLKMARLKLDAKLNESLKTLLLKYPKIFSTPSCIENILTVLKKETSAIFKTRSEPLTYTIACNILLISLQDSYEWPENIAKVYIEDALGDRVWVDLAGCQSFTANVCTVFNTLTRPDDDEISIINESDVLFQVLSKIDIQPRFSINVCRVVHNHVMVQMRDTLGKRGVQPSDILLRNHIKFLTSACGISDVRLFITEKFEQWILNAKMVKPVQDLLCQVAYNCNQYTVDDIKTLENVVSAKLKTRLFSQQYIHCLKGFISSHPNNIDTIVKRVMINELGQTTRSSTNMQVLVMAVHEKPDKAATILSAMFQESLSQKEDYHRALRGFLRELVRQVRQVRNENFPFVTFARGLMQEVESVNKLDQIMKERLAACLTDLICLTCMLSASLLIREAHSAYTKGDKTMVAELRTFFETVSLIQRDAVWWIHSVLPNTLRPQPTDYKAILRKVLFLEPIDVYCVKDNWPGDAERTVIFQLMTEAGLHGDTLMRLLVIGLMRELPLPPSDALDMADKLVARAANAHTADIPRIPLLDRKELFNAIFDITAYCPPLSIVLPVNYTPPKLAISKLYWKGWILLLVLSAFNPTTIGSIGWKEYPTLKLMMEMVMTQNYAPPTDINPMNDIKGEILTYENHLASSSSSTKVTEANSYLLDHVTLLDPNGPPRRMLPSVIDLVKTINTSLHLGQLFCQCRNPDFLLDIINHQGTNKAMNWLKELVEGSQSSLDVLPVSCLCEFLIMGYQERNVNSDTMTAEDSGPSHRSQFKRKHRVKEKLVQQQELIMDRLRSLLKGSSPTACLEVLNYFLAKLSSSQLTMRQLSLKALQDVLDTNNWLLEGIQSLPSFSDILTQLVILILDACAVETNPILLVKYISFLSHHLPDNQLISMVTLLSSIICKRFQFLQNILTDSVTLLNRFIQAFDMFVNGMATPPDNLSIEDLRILCLPPSNDNMLSKEIIIQWDFLNSLWLLLSLSAQYSSDEEHHLVSILLPHSNPVQVVAMATRESQPVLRDSTLQFILCGCNSSLVTSIVGVASLQSLIHYIGSYGVSIVNMNVIIEEIIKRGVTPGSSLIEHVKSHYLRGCTSAGQLLRQWNITIEDSNLKVMVTLPKPKRRHHSYYVPQQTSSSEPPVISKVLSDQSVTTEVIMYLLGNYGDEETCTAVTSSIISLLKSPSDRKTLLKQIESNGFSCLLLSILKRFSPNYNINTTLLAIGDVIKQSSHVLLAVIKNLTKPFHNRPHESIQQAIQVLKTGMTRELLNSPIKCDLIEILDPELCQLIAIGTRNDLLNPHILQISIHETTQRSTCHMIESVLELETNSPDDSSLILNYLWACLHNPRLWQGKVKSRRNVLGLELSIPQLKSIANHLNQDNSFLNISLLTRSCDIKRMRKIISHLSELPTSRDLLIQLYHSVPSIIDLIPINALKPYSVLSIPSEFDSSIHYIIHSMIDSTSNLKRLNSSSMLCKHMAIKHPLLIMRHLSLIGSLLKGKLSISPKQFPKNNLYLIFSNCFHILDLLQPMVFNISFEEVCTVLDPYIEFLKVDGAESTISPCLLLKLLSLLNHYCHHNREDGINYIARHKSSLSSFAEIFYKQQSIITSLLSLLDTKQLYLSTTNTMSELSSHSYEKVLPFLKKLKHGSSEESMLEVLEDLDDSSMRSLDILKYFMPELCRIIQSSDYSHAILALCHNLLIRYLRHSPQALEQVLPHIVNCLKSHDQTVVTATMPSIPDIVALSSGTDAELLLSMLFHLSITLSHDYVSPSISILTGHMAV